MVNAQSIDASKKLVCPGWSDLSQYYLVLFIFHHWTVILTINSSLTQEKDNNNLQIAEVEVKWSEQTRDFKNIDPCIEATYDQLS